MEAIMTADSLEEKIDTNAITQELPPVRICNAKRYIVWLEQQIGQVYHANICTNNCTGIKFDCEYWKRDADTYGVRGEEE